MPGPIPSPVVAWTGGIVHFQEYVEHYLDSTLVWLGVMDTPNHTWRHLAARYQWTGSVDPADDMWIGFDIVNITGGAVDGTWTTSDYTTMEGHCDTFFTAIATNQISNCRLIEYRWYVKSYNPYSIAAPFAPHGSPERVTTKSILGTGASSIGLPGQVAISVTEKTPFPRNWGRFYIPGIDPAVMATGIPRVANAKVDAIATAYRTFVDNMATNQFQMVVPITSLGVGARGSAGAGTPNRRLAQVTKVQVDNTFDVIRRRRPHATTYKKVLP